jgi:hypothetical protein
VMPMPKTNKSNTSGLQFRQTVQIARALIRLET